MESIAPLEKKQTNKRLILVSLFSIYALLFIISPYFRGLFFHEDYYWVSLVINVIFLLTVSMFYKELLEFLRGNWIITSVALCIPLIYTTSFWYSASPFHAANEGLQWFSYIIMFLLLIFWQKKSPKIQDCIWIMCWMTSYALVLLVFFVDFNKIEFKDAILGVRFSSVFQYPNTFASIVSAFVIAGLMAITKSQKMFYQLMYSSALFPFMLSFILTQSRGGLIVFAIGWIIGLLFLTWKEQILYLAYTSVVILLSFWGYTQYVNWLEEEKDIQTALLLVGLSLLFVFIVLSVQFLINKRYKLNIHSKLNLLMPLIIIFTGLISVVSLRTGFREELIVLFPKGLQDRINSITLAENSVQTRILFYKDSFEIWMDHFWFGTGGGGWSILFESYKSLPYFSNQAHSFYMQTLVEVGLIGFLLVSGFFLYVIVKGVVKHIKSESTGILGPAIVIVLVMLLHNAVDFNMSFGTYNLFLFAFLAIIWSISNTQNCSIAKRFYSGWWNRYLSHKSKKVLINFVVVSLFISGTYGAYKSYAYGRANTIINEKVGAGGEYQEIMGHIDRAMSLQPNDPKLRKIKLQVLYSGYEQAEGNGDEFLKQIEQELRRNIALEPTSFAHYLRYAEYLKTLGEVDQALVQLDKALELAPWRQIIYEKNVEYKMKYLIESSDIGNGEKRKSHIDQLKEIMDQFEEKYKVQTEGAPERLQLRDEDILRLNNNNKQLFGKAFYYLGEFEHSLNYLDMNIDRLDEKGKELVILLRLLIYEELGNEDEFNQLLNNSMTKELNIDQTIFKEIKGNPKWKPF